MKKAVSICLSFILLMLVWIVPDFETMYASPSLSMSVSAETVIIGDMVSATVTLPTGYGAQVDIRFPAGLLSYSEASTSNVNTTNVGNGQLTLNMYEALGTSTVTVKFKAVSSGTANIEAVVVKAGDENGDSVEMSGASQSVIIENQAVPDTTKSDDNSLSTLKLSSGTLSPAFKYNVTKYTATVSYDVSSVVVSAKTSNDKAVIEYVTGNGTVKLSVGENVIDVVVKAENGEKVSYTIVVTRKEKEAASETPDPKPSETETESESESETEETIEGMDSGFTWSTKPLLFTESIPTDKVPADFSKETMMMNNVEIPCLQYKKGGLTVLYLKTADGKGSLYVYDKEENNVYLFIKLQFNSRYIIVLEPEVLSAPEGYEMCSLSIEGKGVVTACSYTIDGKVSDFYLLYGLNNEGNMGWYQYDIKEETFQRYSGNVPVTDVPSTDTENGAGSDTETENDSDSSNNDNNNNNGSENDPNADDSELEVLLKEEQDKNIKMLCIFVFVVVVLLVVIVNLILSGRRTDDDEEPEEEFNDFEETYEEVSKDASEDVSEEVTEKVVEDVHEEDLERKIAEEVAKITDENPSSDVNETADAGEITKSEEVDEDFEFIDL